MCFWEMTPVEGSAGERRSRESLDDNAPTRRGPRDRRQRSTKVSFASVAFFHGSTKYWLRNKQDTYVIMLTTSQKTTLEKTPNLHWCVTDNFTQFVKKGLAVALRTVLFWVKNEYFRLIFLMAKNIVDLTKSNHRYAVIFWEMLRKCVYFLFRCVLSETFFSTSVLKIYEKLCFCYFSEISFAESWHLMQMMFKHRLSCSGLIRHAKGMQIYVQHLHQSSRREKIAKRSHRASAVIDLMAKTLL